MISAAQLGELPVMIPPLEVQRSIVEIAELAERESQLLQQLTLKQNQYMSILLMKLARGNK
jgi:restriction endonuclease S subunit